MGGAQPLAVTMNEGVCLVVEVDPERIERRLATAYCDELAPSLDAAVARAQEAAARKEAVSIAILGNAAEVLPELLKRGFQPDVVTDQTSAHDALNGYMIPEISLADAEQLRQSSPALYAERSLDAMGTHVKAMIEFQKRGAIVFDYGNNLRGQAKLSGVENAFDFPGFVPAFIRPLFCDGKGPFRWVALSGHPEDIRVTDRALMELFPENESLIRWLKMAEERVHFQGLPARICWLGHGERHLAGLRFNELVAGGEVNAPIVIGRDHLDAGSVASPYRETEAMRDGSDAIGDWPILNALTNVASGATWVSVHHGGGVGIGYSLHAGMVVVADGTPEAAKRLERVLTNDPGMGVIRHVDAGYERAVEHAKELGPQIPIWPQETGM